MNNQNQDQLLMISYLKEIITFGANSHISNYDYKY